MSYMFYDEPLDAGYHSAVPGNTLKDDMISKVRPAANYFVKALFYIKRILDFLIKAKPVVEQYGPLVKELPKLYKMMQLMQSVNEDQPEIETNSAVEEIPAVEIPIEETEAEPLQDELEGVKLFI